MRADVTWLAGVLISLLPLLALRPPAPACPAAEAIRAERFPHGKHVPAEWLRRDEKKRDCRGCHQYDADPRVEADLPQPESLCDDCHYPIGDAPSITVEGTLRETRDRERAFPTFLHGDHLVMDCKTCHVDPGYRGSVVPEDMWVPSGMGWCLKCHDESSRGVAGGRFDEWITRANAGGAAKRFTDGLNAHPGMRRSGAAVFRHEDHLEPAHMKDPERCDECHQSMASADAVIGEAVFATTDCGRCHREASGDALEVGTAERKVASDSDLTFWHSDHLSPAARATGRITSEGCFACHELGPMRDRDGLLSYPVKDELRSFDGCVDCHDADGVSGRNGTTDWDVADHGDVGHRSGDKRTCNECHVIGDFNKPLATARPVRETDRRRPTLFDVTAQVHPHITGAMEDKSPECTQCHLAEIDLIPSRIRGVPFDHASHLGDDPQPSDCLECHVVQPPKLGGMVQSEAPELGFLTYDELSCRRCHLGIERSDQRLRAAEYRDVGHPVAVFDHNDHLEKAGEVLHACDECHVPLEPQERDARGRYFTEPDDVLTCVKCHDHEQRFEICDGADQTYVAKCLDCHEVHTSGVPEPGRSYPIVRSEVATLAGAQFHPEPSRTACAECHRTRAESLEPRVGVVTCERSYRDHEIHERSEEPGACFACHWGDPQNVAAGGVSELLIDGRLVPNDRLRGRLSIDRIRSVLGDQIEGYPGGRGR